MRNTIYTRAEKEAFWKQKGLLRPAKSDRQGFLAIAAKDYIENLSCYSEVRRLLAADKKPRDVAIFIQRHSEDPILTFNLIKKYAHVYRLFFIPPLETVRSLATEPRHAPSTIVKHRLGDRIYTRSEKETIWKRKGLLRVPKSRRQEALAIASKEYIESLRCYSEVRRLLAKGERPWDVAIFIQQHNEYPILTFNSIMKYAQVYARFFIPPLETVRSLAAEPRGAPSTVVKRRLVLAAQLLEEIEQMQKMIDLQTERVKEQAAKEKSLGVPLPGLRSEISMVTKSLVKLYNTKVAVGLYTREPEKRPSPNQILLDVDKLTPEQQERIVEAVKRFVAFIERVRDSEDYYHRVMDQAEKNDPVKKERN